MGSIQNITFEFWFLFLPVLAAKKMLFATGVSYDVIKVIIEPARERKIKSFERIVLLSFARWQKSKKTADLEVTGEEGTAESKETQIYAAAARIICQNMANVRA